VTGVTRRLLAVLVCALPLAALAAEPLSPHDLGIARAALASADRGQWSEAEAEAAGADDRLPLKLIQWLDFQRPQAGHDFAEIAGFVDANPDWPSLSVLRVRAEAVAGEAPDDAVGPWLDRHHPITPAAKLRQADLVAVGHAAEATAMVRQIWIDGDFSPEEEAVTLAKYGSMLRTEDNIHRLDRLLWDGKSADARRMLPRVPADWRQLADVRLKLAAGTKGADGLAAKLPPSVAGDPGLAFARVKALRRADQDDQAAAIIEHQPALGRPEAWWPERQSIIRRLVQLNEAERAYRLAADHHLRDPSLVVDAEFIAGWLALRQIKDPARALPHFTTIYNLAKLPITLARGAYWAGRAEAALGHDQAATDWFDKAAQFQTTYYGQLAAAMPGVVALDKPVPEPKATPAEREAFERREIVRAALVLLALGQDDRAKPFLGRLADLAQSPAEFAAAADFAEEAGRPDLGVAVARKAFYAGYSLLRAGYPIIWMPRNAGTEQALLLALTRQESAFDRRAVSPSGALGLMQLMPATARQTAASIGMPFATDRLLGDGEYNVTLGQAFFDSLLANFNGSYVLSIAAYNAGPGRVQQWLGQFGDPRQPGVDPVDWVESIPYTETRNYVQRVLENLQVYRLRIGDRSIAFSLATDLKR
jgi:soluble lytic murein transglycosylase